MIDIVNTLNSLGKTVFINWLEECINFPEDRDRVKEKMQAKHDYNTTNDRVNKIYQIIESGLIVEACDKVIASKSKEILDETKEKAKKLKAKYGA